MGRIIFLLFFLLTAFDRSKPPIQFFPDMKDQKIVKPQTAILEPPEGTVPRGERSYMFTDPDVAEKKLKNPLPATKHHLIRGQFIYNVYCLPCHNSDGAGFGPVVKKGFAPPPPLFSDKVKSWKDGKIFHVISAGQGIMPSYAAQISPLDRWTCVLYVRALEKAHRQGAAQ